jgi:hypothetical protein
MAHLGARAFGEISGEVVQTTAFVMRTSFVKDYKPTFFRLVDGLEEEKESALRDKLNVYQRASQEDFEKIPGSPIAYWAPDCVTDLFQRSPSLFDYARPRQGMATTNDELFLRRWWEVSADNTLLTAQSRAVAAESGKKWFPFLKGGEFRKWYGNNEYVVNFKNDGEEVCRYIDTTPGARVGSNGRVINRDTYFKSIVTWTLISGEGTAFRSCDPGFVLGHKGPGIQAEQEKLNNCLTFLNSNVATYLLKILAPTLGFEVGQISKLPVTHLHGNSDEAVLLARNDWDAFETSWDFAEFPWVKRQDSGEDIALCWESWRDAKAADVARMIAIEEGNNKIFIDAYGLQNELSPTVPADQITLERANLEEDAGRLISYIVGCSMGRYSLDEPGMIYSLSGGSAFDVGRYKTFPADQDGIIPITGEHWFVDDAALRVKEFLIAVFGLERLDVNLSWLGDALNRKSNEAAEDAIRRYLSERFFKDHLQTYKKRPIYWLFSSGKQGAFQALVYMHRYNEGTLSRMRSEYVIPLSAKFIGRLEMLEKDAAASSSAAARTKIQKHIESLRKKQAELLAYDEKLRHYADMRISIDLDDGVKANYAKFGDLVAESKAITGGSDE